MQETDSFSLRPFRSFQFHLVVLLSRLSSSFESFVAFIIFEHIILHYRKFCVRDETTRRLCLLASFAFRALSVPSRIDSFYLFLLFFSFFLLCFLFCLSLVSLYLNTGRVSSQMIAIKKKDEDQRRKEEKIDAE